MVSSQLFLTVITPSWHFSICFRLSISGSRGWDKSLENKRVIACERKKTVLSGLCHPTRELENRDCLLVESLVEMGKVLYSPSTWSLAESVLRRTWPWLSPPCWVAAPTSHSAIFSSVLKEITAGNGHFP
jgi:hypothetical protein